MRNWGAVVANRVLEFKKQHRIRIREEHTLEYLAEQSQYIDIFLLILLWVGTSLALLVSGSKCPPILYQDDRIHSAVEIRADLPFTYLDQQATDSVRQEAMNESPLYWAVSPERSAAIKNEMVAAFALMKSSPVRAERFFEENQIGPVIASNLTHYLQNREFEYNFLSKLELLLARGILDSGLQNDYLMTRQTVITQPPNRNFEARPLGAITTAEQAARQLALMAMRPFVVGVSAPDEEALSQIITRILNRRGGNLILDEERTAQMREEIRLHVPSVMRNIPRGEIIIKRGEILTSQDIEIWKAYRKAINAEHSQIFDVQHILLAGIAGFLLMFIGGVYVISICPEIRESNRKLWVVGVTILVSLGINSLLILFGDTFISSLNAPIPVLELIPLAIAPALITVTLGMRPGFIVGVYVSLATAIQLDSSFQVALGGIVITYAVCFAVKGTINYRDFFTKVLFSTMLAYGGLKLLSFFSLEISGNVWYSIFSGLMFNGVSTAALALLLLFILEGVLGVSTDMSLLNFANPSHPLLRRLQREAPGTYRHSKMTADIAEQAALDIDANPVRARVGALYHDIGKLVNTSYFTENQATENSPHTHLKPTVSAMIILGHVKEGFDFAIENNLPSLIRDAILQHHGTDKVGYFYYKAMSSDLRSGISETSFRYPGPLPEEKEIVIIALADACEAAVRSLEKPTHAKIATMVNEIFRLRLKNGQLDRADLSFSDFAKLRDSFVKTLATMHHTRIAYPKNDDDEVDDLFAQTQVIG